MKSTGVKNDAGNEANKSLLSVRDIIRFADEVNIDDVRAVIERQIEYNTAISKEGLAREYGAKIGRTLEKLYDKNDVRVRARAAAARGSPSRRGRRWPSAG